MPRPRQAVRFFLRFLAVVVAGCLAAAGVAWSIVLYNPSLSPWVTRPSVMSGPDGRSYLYPSQHHGFGVEVWAISVGSSDLPYPPLPTWITFPEKGEKEIITTAFGWPLLCMSYHDVTYPYSSRGTDSWTYSHTPNRYFQEPAYRFPLRILPLRFAANAAIFTFPLSAGWLLPALVRSFIRWRRGSCRNCGYDRRGLAQDANCPECGVKSGVGA